jgi:choline transporter-like protein 2/4/5
MVVSFLWIMLMQVIAGVMVWTSMLAMIVLSGFAFKTCVQRFWYLKGISADELNEIETDRLDEDIDIDMTHLIKVQLDAILSDKRVWLLFTVVTGIIFFILSITFVFLRKRVRIAVSLIREASK